ncbi:hypothetical protein ACTJJ4_17835 [Microbacterium sp. 22195]
MPDPSELEAEDTAASTIVSALGTAKVRASAVRVGATVSASSSFVESTLASGTITHFSREA